MRTRVVETAYSLVLFTVCAQAAAGVATLGALTPRANPARLLPAIALGLLVLGGLAAIRHLGRPDRAPRAAANFASSWLSREVLLGLAFGLILIAWIVVGFTASHPVRGILAAALALAFVYAIAEIYRLRTVPAWNTWATPAAFFGTTLVLGAAICAVVLSGSGEVAAARWLARLSAGAALLGLVVTGTHLRRLARHGGVAAESARIVRTGYRGRLAARVVTASLGSGVLLAAGAMDGDEARTAVLVAGGAILLGSELLGRFLFYASHRRIGL